jgi:peptidoglycan/xylan/chitin deacetylase (PgdA/CDA1 family)
VAKVSLDPQLLCVTPDHFEEHLKHLRHHYHPISLQDLKQRLDAGRTLRRTVVITFDDGYADNFHTAYPLLKRYEAPATIFIASGYVGLRQGFWGRELERILLRAEELPEQLKVAICGQSYLWDLGSWARLPDTLPEEYYRWNATLESFPTPRHKAYLELQRLLRPLNKATQMSVLTELSLQARFAKDEPPVCRVLNPEELEVLDRDGLMEVGSHTVSHPVLAAQPLHIQRREIVESKHQLEALLEHPVNSFAYPYGTQEDIGQDSKKLVEEAGYELACANFIAPVTRGSDSFWLPRCLIRDWDGDEFASRLRGFFTNCY